MFTIPLPNYKKITGILNRNSKSIAKSDAVHNRIFAKKSHHLTTHLCLVYETVFVLALLQGNFKTINDCKVNFYVKSTVKHIILKSVIALILVCNRMLFSRAYILCYQTGVVIHGGLIKVWHEKKLFQIQCNLGHSQYILWASSPSMR